MLKFKECSNKRGETEIYSINKKLVTKLKSSERTRYAKNVQSCTTPDDTVAVMFSYFRSENIPLDVRKIHSTLCELKKKYPEMLEEFSFSKNDVYPFSRLLERVFFRLQNSSLISTVNPDFKECIIKADSKEYIRKNVLPLFKKVNQVKLEKMGKEFEQLVTK